MNIFITGGTKGIGRALAQIYLNQGANVGICARNKAQVPLKGAHFYQVDISLGQTLSDAVSSFENQFGPIDIFFANAGVGLSKKSLIPNFELDQNLVNINVQGFLNSIKSIIPLFITRKSGHFVVTSSIASMISLPGNQAYCASKAFVTRYSLSLAHSLKNFNVALTCIEPGYIETELTSNNNHPMPFLMKVDKAAERIVYAVEKKKTIYKFPFIMSSLSYLGGNLFYSIQRFAFKFLKYK